MYLVHFSLRVLKGNLPRACGDVPYDTDNDGKLDLFTPRLRGCTHHHAGNAARLRIYPAPAGVYQHRKRGRTQSTRDPRNMGLFLRDTC